MSQSPPENRNAVESSADEVDSSVGAAQPLDFERLCGAAREGSTTALGELLENCRNYLLLVANLALKPGLQAKVGASDLVQETFVEAQRAFSRFEGASEEELLRWLRRILENKVGNTLKHYYRAARRDVNREVVDQQPTGAFRAVDMPDFKLVSPSGALQFKEDWEACHRTLALLQPEQQDVIRLRVNEELTFEDIGFRMNRSAEAARKLFARAVFRLQNLLESEHDSQHNSHRVQRGR